MRYDTAINLGSAIKLPAFTTSPINRLGLAFFALALGLSSLAFLLVQQSLRQGANDPQIQMAEDIAAALDAGRDPTSLATASNADLRTSLAPFVIVTDADKKVVVATGQLDGRNVTPPDAAFDAAAHNPGHENRITWQPATGVREAAVIVSHNGGYVLVARSLREVEVREDQAQTLTFAALAALIVIGVVLIVVIK